MKDFGLLEDEVGRQKKRNMQKVHRTGVFKMCCENLQRFNMAGMEGGE